MNIELLDKIQKMRGEYIKFQKCVDGYDTVNAKRHKEEFERLLEEINAEIGPIIEKYKNGEQRKIF